MTPGSGLRGALAGSILAVLACAPAPASPPPAAATPPATDGTWPTPTCRARAAAILAEMTLAEKAAAMTLPDTGQLTRADTTALKVGAVFTGAESLPAEPTPAHWRDAAARYHEAAARSGLGVPLLYGTDAVHGHNNVLGAVVFPHAVGLGCTGDPSLVEQVAAATAEAMAATDVDWTFAPMAAVARDERWGRVYEAFGEDPRLVGELTAASVRGLQGSPPGSVPEGSPQIFGESAFRGKKAAGRPYAAA